MKALFRQPNPLPLDQWRRQSRQFLAPAVFAFSTLLLGATAATAQTGPVGCWFGAQGTSPYSQCSNGTVWEIGDKKLTLTNVAGLIGLGEIEFQQNILPPDGYSGDLWTLDIDWTPDYINATTDNLVGFLDYSLEVTQADWVFSKASLGVQATPSGSTPDVSKQISGDSLLSLNVSGTSTLSGPISGKLISITDTWTLAPGEGLDNIRNEYQQAPDVPGPLPLLGAGAAFGFSRRLRSRIKTWRLS